LGWALADKGKKVLIVDCDPQCNLTGMVLGFSGDSEYEDFYSDNPKAQIYNSISPAFNGSQSPLTPAELTETNNENLYLLAGHIDLSLTETQLSIAISTGANSLTALKNLPGAISSLLRLTADEYDIDAVIIDMSPSVGALNQCLLMGSEYFMVPTFPDYFCDQAIRSISSVLPRWNQNIDFFRDESITNNLPQEAPKFIGTVSQRYRPRGGEPAASFQRWIDTIKKSVNDTLVPALRNENMIISEQNFKNSNPDDEPYNLSNIADFNSLIAQSQDHGTPVFALSDEQINRQGIVLRNMKENKRSFQNVFNNLANSVISLTGI
jgi:cellulose biosynthesis protein BcsQ